MCACLFHDRVKGVNMVYMEAKLCFFFLVCVSFFNNANLETNLETMLSLSDVKIKYLQMSNIPYSIKSR